MSSTGAGPQAGRRCRLSVATVLLVVAASGCTGGSEVPGSGAPAPTAAPPPEAGHRTGTFPAPLPHPTDDAASGQSALALGTTAVTAFARPDVGPERWWAELLPLLTPAAALAYEGTDPAEVPAHRVLGPAWPGVSPSSFLATVFVPTDAGDYAVLMVREGGGAPWLVERITLVPPGYTPPAAPTTGRTGT